MRELIISDMEIVSGGGTTDWGEIGAGLGAVALAVAIVATPVGAFGAAAAAGFAYFGGAAIGDGFNGGRILDGDE